LPSTPDLSGWLLLAGAAFSGGAVNSMAGGGTLLTFPALLAILNPVAANATSTMTLLPGSLASIWGYRGELGRARPHLQRLWLPSLLGAVTGTLLVTRLPEKVFATAIPWLLITASVLMVLQVPIARWIGRQAHESPRGATLAAIIAFQFLVGTYGGYFGAGIGILMIASLPFLGLRDIYETNAVKAVLASMINGVTAIIFVISGVVVWRYALVMMLASIAGGYLGAKLSLRLKPPWVRALVIVIGFSVAAYSFYARYGR
jgi:uncharacterized membrane protein YfcA